MESNSDTQESTHLLKATDVAKALNISKAFAYQLMRQGNLKSVRILGARRVRPEDLEQFIRENISN